MVARTLALALLWAGIATAEVPVPVLRARVTDLTNTLDAGQRAALEARLAAFQRAKGRQVAVLIVPTTQPETIEQFGIRVATAWKVGRDIDDGVILVVAKDDRALRIEVGYGLEGALPDVIAKRIIEDVIVPRFRAGDFYGGISDGVERILGAIESEIEGEPLPPPRDPSGDRLPLERTLWLMALPLAVGAIARVALNRFAGAAAAGALAGGLAWWVTGAVTAMIVLGLLCFFLILGAGTGSRTRRRGGWASRGWGSGGLGGGFGGGGGFSGGGGSFGGGGASGRW